MFSTTDNDAVEVLITAARNYEWAKIRDAKYSDPETLRQMSVKLDQAKQAVMGRFAAPHEW
jgi:hypothetical protein